MSFSDQEEIEGLKRLDHQVINAIYDRYFPEVYRFVRYRINDEHIAEDIASDVFVRLLEATNAGRGPEKSLRAWLFGTASHVIVDNLRKKYRHPSEDLPETLQDGKPNINEDYEQQERNQQLRQAMNSLTEEQKNVITMRFNNGFSLEETAAIMKKNINAIKQLQFRALAALHRAMGG